MLRMVKFPFTVRTHATLATMTKLEWLVHHILSLTVRTHATLATMTKLEWLVHRILSLTVRTHATLATMTKLEWLVHRILSFTVRTHAALATMTKLEWLVHRILSFIVCTRDARNDDIATAQCGARSGSPQQEVHIIANVNGQGTIYYIHMYSYLGLKSVQ